MKTKLSVNINKIALLRNSRDGSLPDLFQFARDCETYGADGITVHPRPDERHIRYSDLQPLKDLVTTEFNIEGYPNQKFMDYVKAVKPHQCTLVPDDPSQLTSDHGWDTISNASFLKEVISELKAEGIRVCIFLDADPELCKSAKATGTDRIELYTGPFAERFIENDDEVIQRYSDTARLASDMGLGINAGHDLNLKNLRFFKQHVPCLAEVSIGHALVADALYYGLNNTVQMYQACLK